MEGHETLTSGDGGVIKSISHIFRSDSFIPSSSVFPEIDKERLLDELEIESQGRTRGSENQPITKSKQPDHVEQLIISRVEELRRRGLENFETNRQVYTERLNKAVSARMQVQTFANDSKAKFSEEVTLWKSSMVSARERVQETFEWRRIFRERNGLVRPAKPASSWASIVGLGLIMIVIESAANSYLFAQKNTLGLLGGLLAAFLVSVGNVTVSTFFGMSARYVNCRGVSNILKTLFGISAFFIWLTFAIIYNLAVAHFRDAVETVGAWDQAGLVAMETLKDSPVSLHTLESYILAILGGIISIVAFLKGYNSSDPYPGYSRINQDVWDARDEYNDTLREAVESLAERREEAVEKLREANDEVHRAINDSVDALYGQKALQANLKPFLEQCGIAVNYLLAVYRDANKAARTDDPPAYFDTKFKFQSFTPAEVDESRKVQAEKELAEVSSLVDESIKEIFEVFNEAVSGHYEIDELEGTHIARKSERGLPTTNAE